MPAKKQITKEKILSAAMELLRTKGIDAIQVKTLARTLNCSTQPIYLSFDGMDALRAALIPAAIDLFLQEIGASEAMRHPLYGMPYIQFAQREKNLFHFLFMRPNAYREMREALAPVLERSIRRLMERYQIDYPEAHHFHDQLWVHTHGIASMIATDFCDWNMDKVEKMLSECEQYLSRKYGAQNV